MIFLPSRRHAVESSKESPGEVEKKEEKRESVLRRKNKPGNNLNVLKATIANRKETQAQVRMTLRLRLQTQRRDAVGYWIGTNVPIKSLKKVSEQRYLTEKPFRGPPSGKKEKKKNERQKKRPTGSCSEIKTIRFRGLSAYERPKTITSKTNGPAYRGKERKKKSTVAPTGRFPHIIGGSRSSQQHQKGKR